jgi:methionyl-tRNA formyltransferase
MKIVFIGSVEIGHTVLESIYEINGSVDIVYTLPLEKSSTISGFVDFGHIAEEHGSKLIRTANINSPEHIEEIRTVSPDLVIVCGWQRLVCDEIIKIPKLGTFGFHSSLLPKYRGRAPINWAILLGERETGITMFYFTPHADDGDIIAQKRFPILFNDDCHTIYQKAAQAGAELLREYLPKFEDGTAPRIHNPSGTYPEYPKRTPVDGLIDFQRSALDIYNFVRALAKPYPGAFYYDKNGNRIIVWKIEIVFDETRIQPNDIVFDTLDLKIRLLDWEAV